MRSHYARYLVAALAARGGDFRCRVCHSSTLWVKYTLKVCRATIGCGFTSAICPIISSEEVEVEVEVESDFPLGPHHWSLAVNCCSKPCPFVTRSTWIASDCAAFVDRETATSAAPVPCPCPRCPSLLPHQCFHWPWQSSAPSFLHESSEARLVKHLAPTPHRPRGPHVLFWPAWQVGPLQAVRHHDCHQSPRLCWLHWRSCSACSRPHCLGGR